MRKATILLLAGLVLLLTSISAAEAAVPQLITVQGRLRNATTLEPLVGNYDVNFTIWDDATAGNMLYDETQSIIPDQFGIFQILLGSINILNLPFNQQYYLQLSVNGSTLSPRHSMTSSAYTYRSGVSNDVQCTNCVNTSKIADDAVTFEKYNCMNYTCTGGGSMDIPRPNSTCMDSDGCTIRITEYGLFIGFWSDISFAYLGTFGDMWATTVLYGGGTTGHFAGISNATYAENVSNSGSCFIKDRGFFPGPNNWSVTCGSAFSSCNYWLCD